MNLSSRRVNRVYRGWSYKGKHNGIFEKYNNLSFSAILAFSEQNFYGILIIKDLNDSFIFKYFLSKLIETRRNIF